jgi:hypothetical protein
MKMQHWLGIALLFAVGYYAGTKGWLAPVLAKIPTGG